MLKHILSSKLAALAGLLMLGTSTASFAATVTIDGGSSATVDGWLIAPQVGITLQANTDSRGDLTIVKNAKFTTNAPLDITFTQVNPPGDNPIILTNETLTNSTGADWTAFTFSLTSPATFASLSGIFLPAVGTGVNYTQSSLTNQKKAATYTGSQLNGSTSDWGDSTANNEMVIFAPLSAPGSATVFTLAETPTASAPTVPLPSASWQALITLLALGLLTIARKIKSVIV